MHSRTNTPFISRCFLVAFLAMLLLCAGEARAHYPWVEMADSAPGAKNEPRIRFGWGHTFPSENFLGGDDLEESFLLSASGAKIALQPSTATEFVAPGGLAGGTYLVAAQRKASFYTKTVDGGKRQCKKGLDNVVKCSWSTMSMKGVVSLGAGKGAVDRAVGHPLEIIPLANPARLKVGDMLPVRVLFRGKPYSGEIAALYHTLAEKKETPADPFTTDANGWGSLRIASPGVWLLKAQHALPFVRPEECDVESYVATLSFTIR
jgi:uncharacterized GH25 family protein